LLLCCPEQLIPVFRLEIFAAAAAAAAAAVVVVLLLLIYLWRFIRVCM
jgi:hypothetical protein